MAEILTGATRKEAAENSLISYKDASDAAVTHLPARCALFVCHVDVQMCCAMVSWHVLVRRERVVKVCQALFRRL